MTCPTLADHEFGEPRIVAVGTHDTRGRWQEWVRICARCQRLQRWREWPQESAAPSIRAARWVVD